MPAYEMCDLFLYKHFYLLYIHANVRNFVELEFHIVFNSGFPDYSDAQELIPERPLQKTSAK